MGRPAVNHSVRIVTIILALAAVQPANADECGDAVREYNVILPLLNDAVQHFSSCLANSLGHDSCVTDFASMRALYNQFESAVAVYEKICN
jgi:hypothetical protein